MGGAATVAAVALCSPVSFAPMQVGLSRGPWEGPLGGPSEVPRGVPRGLPLGVPRGLPRGAPRGVPRGVPRGFPQGIPWRLPGGVPQEGERRGMGWAPRLRQDIAPCVALPAVLLPLRMTALSDELEGR